MKALRCMSALWRLSCVLWCCYLSRREYIIYCYEPGVHMYTDTYRYTTFPALFLSLLHLEINDTSVCKHPKTITIVADNRRGVTTCLCICVRVCVCWRALVRAFVSKCTSTHSHTFQGNARACWKSPSRSEWLLSSCSSTRSLLFNLCVPVAIGNEVWSIPCFPLVTYDANTHNSHSCAR